ncbi:hypothetical protein CPU12_10110 [Malaciobacter molluscorum LMG 25693]|uniref:VWFA domain-containing protein n=1 Tax=Malaciobacter molluscorum LMG 25693 TaxID=870501 RepID=A0A2G1DG98_9BACT|nr:immunoglobulin-like domain-containing protein [Malaciobacter molluscorum]PHO17513.1 hypothetical protein CPU12_10110 [Malaciobacter molluscorum LMG 25693]
MLNLIVKEPNGKYDVVSVKEDMVISPKAGQQFYFDNYSGSNYTFNLVDGDKSIELIINLDPPVKIIFNDMVDLITNQGDEKTVLGMINNPTGIYDLQNTVMNTNFKGDDVISSLKDMLSKSELGTNDGILIDNFGSLSSALDAAAAGGPQGDTSTFNPISFDEISESNVLAGRTQLDIDVNGNLNPANIDGNNNANNNITTTPTTTTPTTTTPNTTKVNLTATKEVEAGEDITYTASVANPPKTDLVIKLSNGAEITIKAGETSGSVTVASHDDVYGETDGTTEDVSITGTTGGGYEDLDTSATATTVVTEDTPDTTKVNLTATKEVEAGEDITYTASVANPPKTDLVIKLSNGAEITIKAGETSGSVTVASHDDVYGETDGTTEDVSITGTTGGGYEDLDTSATATTVVTEDTPDTTKVTLNDLTVDEGSGKATIGASLDYTPKTELTITLSNGATITFGPDYVPGTVVQSTEFDVQDDDVYKDSETYQVSITGAQGGDFEDLDTTDTATVTVNDTVTPVNVTVTATVSTPKVIDVNTNLGENTDVTVSAYNVYGHKGELAVVSGTDHDGFGVKGNTSGSGASSELGHGYNGKSEKIVFDFTKDVDSLDVSFAWRNNQETAKITFSKDGKPIGYATVSGGGTDEDAVVRYYDMNGNLLKEVPAQGGSDRVDLAYTFEFPGKDGNPMAFDKAEFSAPGYDDDYLINKVTYREVIDPEVDSVSTTEGKITFTIQIDENYPPQGKAKAIVEINGKEYEVEINATGRGTVTVNAKDIPDVSNVDVHVKEIIGGNYEKVNGTSDTFDLSDSFNDVVSSTDDSVTIKEDEVYTFDETDFGEYGEAVKQFKITELPSEGTLYLIVHKGEIIIDKYGNKHVATEDTRVPIHEGQVVSLADVAAGNVVYVPKENSDEDVDLKFQVGDKDGNFNDTEYKTDIKIDAVADAPEASINISGGVEKTVPVDSKGGNNGYGNGDQNAPGNSENHNNAENAGGNQESGTLDIIKIGNKTFSIEDALNNENKDTTSGDDVITYDNIYGGTNINSGAGDDLIVIKGDINGGAVAGGPGTDVLYLGKSASNYEILNYNGPEQGHDNIDCQIRDKQTGKILTVNNVEGIVFADGTTKGDVEVPTTPPETRTEVEYDVDINAALTDLDGSESLTVTITNVPEDAKLTCSNPDYTLTNNHDGTWTVNLPEGTKSVSETLKMTVPKGTENIDIGITARATESRDNENGDNYKETSDSDSLVYAEDESQTLNYDANTEKGHENIIIVLDVSGSMNDKVRLEDGSWTTRLALAKEALENMIDTYQKYSNVKINLTTFAGRADDVDGEGSEGGWYSPEDALNILNNLNASGGTNYEDALKETYSDYVPPVNGEKATVYYISDGKPNVENYDGCQDDPWNIIDKPYLDKWKDFLEDHVKELNVIGIGKNITDSTYLDMIAQKVGNVKTNVTIIEDENDLKDKLVENVYEKVEGNVLDNITGGDGNITVDSIVVDGVTHTASEASNNIIVIHTKSGGILEFNFETGDYTFGGERNSMVGDHENFSVNVSDEDGDSAKLDVNINIVNDIDTTASAPTLSFSISENGTTLATNEYDYKVHNSYSKSFDDEDNYINIHNDYKGWNGLNTYDGDDVVNIGDDVNYGSINLGDGDDYISIGHRVGDLGWATIDGGTGNDSIHLKGYSVEDYYNNVDNIQNKILNFENIKVGDTVIKGNADVFNNTNISNHSVSTTVYSYTITLAAALTDLDGSEELSKVRLEDIPDSVTSIKDSSGVEYPVTNGVVELPVESGKEEEFTFVSNEKLDSTDINSMKASVTSTESESDDTNTVSTNAKLEVDVDSHNHMTGTDADEKFDSHGSNATIDAGKGDDDIVFHAGDKVDGGEGEDTLLILDDDESIDISGINTINASTDLSEVHNIEAIDLTNDIKDNLVIDEEAIENLTDNENILKIFGDDSGDRVTLEGGSDNWKSSGQFTDDDGTTFNVFEGTTSGTSNIKVLIDEDVSVDPDI